MKNQNLIYSGKKKYSDFYLFGDQPTSCPICGARTEVILELSDSTAKTQYDECLADVCKYKFIIEEDI